MDIMEQLTRESNHYKRCMELLPLIIDQQATSEDIEFFHKHSVNWPEVLDCYHKEKAFREAIRSKLGILPAPEDLMESIRQSIVRA